MTGADTSSGRSTRACASTWMAAPICMATPLWISSCAPGGRSRAGRPRCPGACAWCWSSPPRAWATPSPRRAAGASPTVTPSRCCMSASPEGSLPLTAQPPLPQGARGRPGSPLPRTGRGVGGEGASPLSRVQGEGLGVRAPLWVYALAVLALALAVLPYAAGYLAAPRGMIFLGALNNLGDTGQYLAALRQGTEGHLLYVNQYTRLRVAPVLIYPLYTATGLLLAPLRLPAVALYQLLHLLAAVALLAALWRFCRTVVPGKPVLAYAVALFGGGLYLPALLLSGLVRLPFAPVALTAPELSLFATLLLTPHGAVGLAAELWALAGYVRWRSGGGLWPWGGSLRHLAALSVGGLVLGLSYPF